MTDPTKDLTRRQLLGGIATLGAATAATGAGTYALFSDSETSAGNTVSAGTLDLQNADGNSLSASTKLQETNFTPGSGGSWSIGLQNSGTISGALDLGIDYREPTNGGTSQIDPDDGPFDYASYWDSVFESRVANVGWTPGPGGETVRLEELGINDEVSMAVTANSAKGNDVINIKVPDAADFHNLSYVVDAGSTGTADFHIGAYGPASDDPRAFYKTVEGSSWSSEKTPSGDGTQGNPYTASFANGTIKWVTSVSNGNYYFAAIFPEGTFDDARVGGIASYEQPNGAPEQWYPVPFTPGFDWSYGVNSNNYVHVGSGDTRHLGNVLDVNISIYDSYDSATGSGSGKTVIASGMLANVLPDVLSNHSLNGTDYLVVDYYLPSNAGNVVQGDEVAIDVEAELVQV